MFATLIVLFLIHRRQRDQEREKRHQYWLEQVSDPDSVSLIPSP
jgi:preprotein translocase subunit YajC